ncbi:hypothetical protein ID866_7511 [Astraeus odoratus]|nr:hypothetical protein ID866_7511 [Astraeus odoratus]
MVKQAAVSEAYALLGLEQGATLEQVRSVYKQKALRTHPDKNPGNAEATTQFQQLGEAYSIIQKHLQSGGHSYGDDDYYSDADSQYDSDDDYFYFHDDDVEARRAEFFKHLFEEIYNGRYGDRYRHYAGSNRGYHYQRTPDTPEERRARMQSEREERERAEQRREQQKAERKAFEARMREKERKEAEERQRAKAASKKAEAEKRRQKAAETAEAQQQRAQTLRSATFAAARTGDAKLVKKGVWEDSVDPAGGEVKTGCEKFVKEHPQDPKETLLHIASQHGDVDLVEWLGAHSRSTQF